MGWGECQEVGPTIGRGLGGIDTGGRAIFEWVVGVEGVREGMNYVWNVGNEGYSFYCDPRLQLRPYALESTGSRPISEVKLVTASSVLW